MDKLRKWFDKIGKWFDKRIEKSFQRQEDRMFDKSKVKYNDGDNT